MKERLKKYLKSGVSMFASMVGITLCEIDLGFGPSFSMEVDMDTIGNLIEYGERAAMWF